MNRHEQIAALEKLKPVESALKGFFEEHSVIHWIGATDQGMPCLSLIFFTEADMNKYDAAIKNFPPTDPLASHLKSVPIKRSIDGVFVAYENL